MGKTLKAFNIDDLHSVFLSANREAMKDFPKEYDSPEAGKAIEASRISGAFWDRIWIMNATARNEHDDAAKPILVYRTPFVKDGVKTEPSTAAYKCPRCGCEVGELYIPESHLQGEDHYCADCGQRLDWESVERGLRVGKEEQE